MLTDVRDALLKRGARIHQVVRIVEGRDIVVEEPVDEPLAVTRDHHRFGIPIQQHIAEIEDHLGDRGPVGSRSGILRHQLVICHLRFSRPAFHIHLALFIIVQRRSARCSSFPTLQA